MSLIVGVDEVGRGPWAGPLVAAAVVWDNARRLVGLADSKTLSYKKRLELAQHIRRDAIDIGIGWVSAPEIDQFGLAQANRQAMLRALGSLNCGGLPIVIDGNVDYLKSEYNCKTIVKADASIKAVSAASIIAKVARDFYMKQVSTIYPQYGFESHVGYGTSKHILSLKRYGVSPLHRMAFKPVQQFTPG